MHRKKIIHIIQSLDSGGCENMLLRTLPLIVGFEHTIITLRDRGELARNFEEKNIHVINIGQKSFFDIGSYGQLLKTVENEQPNIVITYLFHADAIGRLFLQTFTKYKIIPFLRTTYNHKKYFLARLFEKTTKYFVKYYLANSESVHNFYVKNIGITPEKITVVPNGIDVDFYNKVERSESLRESLGIGKKEVAIICVANLHINKGHAYLLESFENIYEKYKNIKLLIVGDGEERINLLDQIENYRSKNNILFLGRRDDVPKLLKISDIFVLPTLFEGMSNALMEAMASKLPIVTTNIPENRNLIENLTNGILVPTENSKALRDSLVQLFKSIEKRTILASAAKNSIKKRFDINIIAEKWKEALDKFAL
jgi:glycosyltransferase involved in cell wall biosynthesis